MSDIKMSAVGRDWLNANFLNEWETTNHARNLREIIVLFKHLRLLDSITDDLEDEYVTKLEVLETRLNRLAYFKEQVEEE